MVDAGKFGYSLINLLSKGQFDVVVVESDENRRNIVKNTLNALAILGNGCNKELLHKDMKTDLDLTCAAAHRVLA